MANSRLQSEIEQEIFRDIPLNLTVHPVTGNLRVLANADSIKQSVKNIVLTNFYERPYNPEFGGDVLSQLFENMDPITEYNISKNIRVSLENYEPRVIVDDIITTVYEDQNALSVKIKFSVQTIPEPLEVNVLLERIR